MQANTPGNPVPAEKFPPKLAQVNTAAQKTPMAINDTSNILNSLNGYMPNTASPCCETYVDKGKHERIIKFTPMLMYPRLKLFNAFSAANTQPNTATLKISATVPSCFGMYLYSVQYTETKHSRKRMKDTTCCNAVNAKPAGHPIRAFSSSNCLSGFVIMVPAGIVSGIFRTQLMKIFMKNCAPKYNTSFAVIDIGTESN